MNTGQYLSRLRSVYISMLSGVIAIALISYFFLKPTNGIATGQSLYVMLGFTTGIFFLLLYLLLNKQKNREAANYKKLSEKLIAFQNNYVTVLAMLLGPALLNFILFGIGGPFMNYYVGLFFLTILGTRFPSVSHVSKCLQLSQKESTQLIDKQSKLF